MYSFDEKSARNADKAGGKITEFGEYVGIFNRAEMIKSKNGAQGIEFAFECENEDYAIFTIYTHSKAGEPTFGFDKINALMKILRAPNITPTNAILPKYNFDAKEMVDTSVQAFKELMGKKVGIMFNTKDNEWDGKVTKQLEVAMFFRPDDRMTVTEILDKATVAKEADRMAAKLRHIPLGGGGGKSIAAGNKAAQQAVNDDLDSDIPFN